MITVKNSAKISSAWVIIVALSILGFTQLLAQTVNVGSGSYTTVFPGVDAAGRNGFPTGTPFTTGIAATKPVPTNDWWSKKIKNAHADNLFNYPFTLKTVNNGLVVTYMPWGPIDNILPVIVGVTGLNAAAAKIADFTDWTIKMDWETNNKHFTATAGIGMPFLYFTKDTADLAQVTVNQGTVTISNEMLLVENARNGADFAIYAPVGSVWIQSGNSYTSTLNGKNYWSLGFIPLNASNFQSTANTYRKYAYVFPTNTVADWNYNPNTAIVTTHFHVAVDVKEGTDSTILMGLLPHQWANLGSGAPPFTPHTYPTVRGELKTIDANQFTVENTFYGILPTLPYLDNYSAGFSPAALGQKVKLLENDQLNSWTDSYNEGQEMNRLIQTARIAQLTGDTVAFQKLLNTVKSRLENWLTYSAGEVAFLFFYNQTWTAMLGYPAGHGQDVNINDHHFHWGYFIHAASFLEQFEPGWAANWGGMVNLLVRDAATPNRNDSLFPYLRNFSPYAGHCWANGFATFPQGNDQESTSESMQFNSSLIHWGAVTGNDSLRDLGIYLYTTEQSAVEEYWFDMYNRNFGPNQQYSLVSRVWGNSYDNGTFWTADIAASYGIELYPIHGGALYLGHNTSYVNQLWAEIEQNTGILTNDPNVNLWHDIMWQYLAFSDPAKAIGLYNSYPNRNLKFGVSDALTYHWLHAMNVLGNVNAAVTSNHPLAATFINNGDTTYVAQNYSNTPISVTFSSGFVLPVPPRKLVTSKDIDLNGVLSSSFLSAYPGGSVDLTLAVSGGSPSHVAFYNGDTLLTTLSQPPFVVTPGNLPAGRHPFYARIYDGAKFNVSNLVTVVVGEQLPFSGQPHTIPGTIAAAHYDIFEGGNGNGIAYQDMSVLNAGNFRLNESVDAQLHPTEGETVGWIAPGEWLEYTVDVQQPGMYTVNIRFASGNSAGGGPIRLETDGQIVAGNTSVNHSGSWNTWATKTINNVPLKGGKQVLRLYFEGGELNVGRLTFTYAAPLPFAQPVANAGPNQIVVRPQVNAQLNGTASTNGGAGNLSYLWTQIYGPTTLQFVNDTAAMPTVSTLSEGVYLIKLLVSNGNFTDQDEVYLISSLTNNVAPKISISNPQHNAVYLENEPITITALASDLNDSVVRVDFYSNNQWLGAANQQPYTINWQPSPGNYALVATATDGFGDSTRSAPIAVTIDPAPPCVGTSWNGDFSYRFSAAADNPTVTFIPSRAGVGTPTCILYYGTDPGNMPGYLVSPNVPFTINAAKGTRTYFYYTYSFPGAGERNNSAHKNTYVVGSCSNIGTEQLYPGLAYNFFPNPVKNNLWIELPETGNFLVEISSVSGQLVKQFAVAGGLQYLDVQNLAAGLYIVNLSNTQGSVSFKMVKAAP